MKFLADRMLGTLTRYLRLMGYDTLSANSLEPGNSREDTALLALARAEGRVLLTRDRDLARRGGDQAVYLPGEDVMDQVRALSSLGLITPSLVMDRCSLCNTLLRPATEAEVREADYVPAGQDAPGCYTCPGCRRVYWKGSHARNLRESLEKGLDPP